MYLLGGENRARHAFIDASIEVFLEQAQNSEVVPYVGEWDLADQRDIANDLIIPNMRHGEIQPVKGMAQKHGAVILAVMPNEEYVKLPREMSAQTEAQLAISKRVLLENGASWRKAHRALDRLSAGPRHFSVGYDEKSYAYVGAAQFTGKIQDKRYYMEGRPIVVLPLEESVPRITPATMCHEIKHIEQTLDNPAMTYDTAVDLSDVRLSQELEAYDIEASMIDGLARADYVPLEGEDPRYTVDEVGQAVSVAHAVSRARRDANMHYGWSDRFRPGHEVKWALAERELTNIYNH